MLGSAEVCIWGHSRRPHLEARELPDTPYHWNSIVIICHVNRGIVVAYPPNQTFLPPLSTLQDDHSVCPLSKSDRLVVCWHGKQPIIAEIAAELFFAGDCVSFGITTFWPSLPSSWLEDSRMFRDSHQSSSVIFSTPESVNHFLLPRGAKKCTFGCCSLIFIIVG